MSKSAVQLSGMLVALVTPFSADGTEIDRNALSEHINRLIDCGIQGLVPNGSTGEFVSLSAAERRDVVEVAVKAADGRVPVIAGTGALTTKETIELSKHAAQAGASAVMIVPPFYDALSAEELRDHLQAVHQESGLPIMYYNIPSASGLRLSAAELAGLSSIVGVSYIKDTSGDAVELSELLLKHSDRITTFNGWDTLTFFGLASGASGAVWGAINVFPELAMQLWDALSIRKDLVAGREVWSKLWPLCAFFESHNYAASIKAGMELTGHAAGPVRPPFKPLSPEHLRELASLLASAGILADGSRL